MLKVLILNFNFVLCSYDYMSNLREEIKDLTKTLNQLSEERSNLLIALQMQEENYHHTFRKYEDCVETLLRQKDEKIETLLTPLENTKIVWKLSYVKKMRKSKLC